MFSKLTQWFEKNDREFHASIQDPQARKKLYYQLSKARKTFLLLALSQALFFVLVVIAAIFLKAFQVKLFMCRLCLC